METISSQNTVRAGPFIFTSSVSIGADYSSGPFWSSEVTRQTGFIFEKMARELSTADSSLGSVLSLLQHFKGRDVAAGFIQKRREHFSDRAIPASTGVSVSSLPNSSALVAVEAIAAPIGSQIDHVTTDASPINTGSGYSQAVRYGEFIFCSGVMASDYRSGAAYFGAKGTGVAEAARVDPNFWSGVPVKMELDYILSQKLSPVLEAAGGSLDTIAVAHVHLLNPRRDLAMFVETWSDAFDNYPATSVSPALGLGTLGGRIEVSVIALAVDSINPVSESISGSLPLMHFGLGDPARRIGDLVFIGSQFAADDQGLLTEIREETRQAERGHQAELEMEAILDQLKAICVSAGGSVLDVVRLRLDMDSMQDLPHAIRAIPERLLPRCVIGVVETAERGYVPGCSLGVDAVAYIPQADILSESGNT